MTDKLSAETLNRPPRLQPTPLVGEIDIPAPPSEPERQNQNLLLTMLPVLGIGFTGIFYLLFMGSSSGGSALFAIPMLASGGLAILTALITLSYQEVERLRGFAMQRRRYNRTLDRRMERLQAAREVQLESNHEIFPPPGALLARVQRLDLSLWSRGPHDADFLEARLGTGKAESKVIIRPPDPDSEGPDARRAMDMVFDFKYVPDSAVTFNLLRAGSLGIVGDRDDVLAFVYGIIAQIATSHTPGDVHVYVLSSRVGYRSWNWLRWLPHTSKGNTGGFPDYLAFSPDSVRQLLDTLIRQAETRRTALKAEEGGEKPKDVIVVVLDNLNNLKEELAYKTLLTAHDVGVIALALTTEISEVPNECQGVISIADDRFELRLVGPEGKTLEGKVDPITRAQAELVARQLANFTTPTAGDSGRVPARINFLQMYGVPNIQQIGIEDRWARPVNKKAILPVPSPIGNVSFSSQLMFDLSEHAHGPHGMVGGTTGSGKSELLQTLVCAMCCEHHPYLLSFLLIDYKGGATFNIFRDLPHTAGIITNLNVVEALRALEAIKSENRRRQIFLADQNAEDITEYHKRLQHTGGKFPPNWIPLPHLVIIIDEFAELKSQLPNFLDELVATVRVGRSLGMHLILATQRPAGNITQEMGANLNFRISLRVQGVDESRDMLRRPDAAYIPPSMPGRAFFLVGNDLKEFQTAWVGLEYDERVYSDVPEEPPITLRLVRNEEIIDLAKEEMPETEAAPTTESEPAGEPMRIPILAEALTTHMRRIFDEMGARKTETVLLESLPDAIPLSQVLRSARYGGWDGVTWQPAGPDLQWGNVPVGLIDDIANRSQPPLQVDFPRLGGHILVVGGSGTGKTTFLRSLAMSLAHLYRPDEAHIYVLSMTGRVLDMLEGLPHVGAVIRNEEAERIERLFRFLFETLEARRYALAQVNADDLLQYNNRIVRQGGQPLPAIYVLIDNFVELQKFFEEDLDSLVAIMRDGRPAGIYFAVTTPTISITYKVVNLIEQRFALRMTERSDYTQLLGRLEGREVNPRAGSGLLSGKPPEHCQIALPGDGDDDDQRVTHMEGVIQAMDAAWGDRPRPMPIVTLPTNVLLDNLLAAMPERASVGPFAKNFEFLQTPIGLEKDKLQPKVLNWAQDGGHFIVTGPVKSGKSSLMRTMLFGAMQRYSPEELSVLLVDFGKQSLIRLQRLPHVIDYVTDEETLIRHLKHFNSELNWRMQQLDEQRKQLADNPDAVPDVASAYNFPALVIAVDDYDQLRDVMTTGYDMLGDLARVVRGDASLGIHIIVAGETNNFMSGMDRLVRQIKLARSGFCLVDPEAVDFMGGRVTRAMRAIEMPDGRGYQLTRNTMDLIQFAHTQEIVPTVRRINEKWEFYSRAQWLHPASEEELAATAVTSAPEAAPRRPGSMNANFDFDLTGAIDDYKKQQAEKRARQQSGAAEGAPASQS